MEIHFVTHSAEETRQVGRLLAACLLPGDVVLLSGDLGAGKTQFAQGVASGLGIPVVPTSPTFNLVISYAEGRLPLHHFDLYRLETAQQLEDLGVSEYVESGGVCLVEWAEKFPDVLEGHIAIKIMKQGEDVRLIAITATSEEVFARIRTIGMERVGSECTCQAASTNASLPVEQESLQHGEMPQENARSWFDPPVDERATFLADRPSIGYVLAFDTANEVVSIGLGALLDQSREVVPVAVREIAAHRQSNTTLVPQIAELMRLNGIERQQLACIAVGRGPGSFTGVRIALATAKGIAQALGLPLVTLSTLDAIAWNAQANDVRGELLVIADAMRKEVYPARYTLSDEGIARYDADYVIKAEAFADQLADTSIRMIGDGLVKYADLFGSKGELLREELWEVTGRGLLLAFQDAWQKGLIDPLDTISHDPALALPIYTRLSDAEENERARCSAPAKRNLASGVQTLEPPDASTRHTMHRASRFMSDTGDALVYRPMKETDIEQVSMLERQMMGTDAWTARLFLDDLGQRHRTWWVVTYQGKPIGYAGGMVVDDDLQILKIATDPAHCRQGIARELVSRIAEDARNLGASTCSLEVRASNEGAHDFYQAIGLCDTGVRPHYYSDHEDAIIMNGPLPVLQHDVGGMHLVHHENDLHREVADSCNHKAPLILAIESSCDETAAALIDGSGILLSDVVASQIEFHARFGGVVPEIASRKHIEAICGVCEEALACGVEWGDLDAIAATYAPGLLGGLVVGVAYAKGAAWALDIPFIGVNHLEGHLYANKLAEKDFSPPAVVSLLSGGNTQLIWMRDWGDYVILGATIDDAVGEAFDKVSKALGLGYPGGPIIGKLAEQGDPNAIAFPRALLHSHDYRFSLSGLKTAVVNYVNGEREAGRELDLPNIAASFQQAVIDVQVAKARTALEETGAPTLCLGGGVAANGALRNAYERMCAQKGVKLVLPPLASCGDNAGMIALVALERYAQKKFWPLDSDALAHADLSEPY